jgi:hypothetical protein
LIADDIDDICIDDFTTLFAGDQFLSGDQFSRVQMSGTIRLVVRNEIRRQI